MHVFWNFFRLANAISGVPGYGDEVVYQLCRGRARMTRRLKVLPFFEKQVANIAENVMKSKPQPVKLGLFEEFK